MSCNKIRKKSSSLTNRKYEQNKQNVEEPRDPFVTKDTLQRLAQQQLNEISDVDFKKVDFFKQAPRMFAQEIMGWDNPPRSFNFKEQKAKSKPKSACKTRGTVYLTSHIPNLQSKERVRINTAAVEARSDEVLVCKPLITQPSERTNNNFVVDHRPTENLISSKPRNDPSKLYNIIKAIERENSKLLRKLFNTKLSFRSYQGKRVAMKNTSRPVSSFHKSKESSSIRKEDFKNNTDTMFNFILINNKELTPNSTIRSAKPDLKSIRKFALQYSDNEDFIFHSEKNTTHRFFNRAKMASNILSRFK